MNYLAGTNRLDGREQSREKRQVVLDAVSPRVQNNDPEVKLPQIVLEFEAAVNRYQDVDVPLRESNDAIIRQSAPTGLRDGHYIVGGEGLADARMSTLVY